VYATDLVDRVSVVGTGEKQKIAIYKDGVGIFVRRRFVCRETHRAQSKKDENRFLHFFVIRVHPRKSAAK
jgi:hypothetical protein